MDKIRFQEAPQIRIQESGATITTLRSKMGNFRLWKKRTNLHTVGIAEVCNRRRASLHAFSLTSGHVKKSCAPGLLFLTDSYRADAFETYWQLLEIRDRPVVKLHAPKATSFHAESSSGCLSLARRLAGTCRSQHFWLTLCAGKATAVKPLIFTAPSNGGALTSSPKF